jgi:hypothetical protein
MITLQLTINKNAPTAGHRRALKRLFWKSRSVQAIGVGAEKTAVKGAEDISRGGGEIHLDHN